MSYYTKSDARSEADYQYEKIADWIDSAADDETKLMLINAMIEKLVKVKRELQ